MAVEKSGRSADFDEISDELRASLRGSIISAHEDYEKSKSQTKFNPNNSADDHQSVTRSTSSHYHQNRIQTLRGSSESMVSSLVKSERIGHVSFKTYYFKVKPDLVS